jgi:excinuclease ABC subunit C
LLIVDGGKGQLGRAVQVLESSGLAGKVPVAGLAKGHEELYLPGQATPIVLPRGSEGLHLLQRLRDEAHRTALTQHQSQRSKAGLASQLETISGIGPSRRKALLLAFGDLDAIRRAPLKDIMAVRGITRQLAERVKAEI